MGCAQAHPNVLGLPGVQFSTRQSRFLGLCPVKNPENTGHVHCPVFSGFLTGLPEAWLGGGARSALGALVECEEEGYPSPGSCTLVKRMVEPQPD